MNDDTTSPFSSQARVRVQRQILDAARECFRTKGVRKTTMADVAEVSGCTRQLVYKVFLGRRELIETAAAARVIELAESLTPKRWAREPDVEQFVATSVAIIEGVRSDPELEVLLGDKSPVTLHEVLWMDSVRRSGTQFWLPWLRRARQAGLLRDDFGDDELSDWLQTVYASIVLRRNIGADEERTMIKRFVLTSLTMAASKPLN